MLMLPKASFFVFPLLLIHFGLSAQLEYQMPEKVPAEYQFDPLVQFDEIVSEGYPGASERDIERFAELTAFGKSSLFEDGLVYLGWAEMESYLNSVLQNVLPDDLNPNEVHVYPTRMTEVNAFAIHDGSLFFNIGMFAEIEDEAALASILAHELAHYIHRDSQEEFFGSLKSYTAANRNNLELKLESAHNNRQQESAADSLGWILTSEAGYSLQSSEQTMLNLLDLEQREFFESEDEDDGTDTVGDTLIFDLGQLLASHPSFERRIEALREFISDNNVEGTNYQVSEQLFKLLKKEARNEVLKLNLQANVNLGCFKKSLSYLVDDIENSQYHYYCLESLRRYLYLFPDEREDTLLINSSYSLASAETWSELFFRVFKDSVLATKGSEWFSAGIGNDTIASYATVLQFLEDQYPGDLAPETFLSLALIHKDSSELKSEAYLEQYLASGEANQSYGGYLKNEDENPGMNTGTRDLYLIDEVDFIEDRYYGVHFRQLLSRQRNPEIFALAEGTINDYFKEENTEVISIPDLKKESLREYLDFRNLVVTLAIVKFSQEYRDAAEEDDSRGLNFKAEEEVVIDDLNLFHYRPDLWELYRKYDLENVRYIGATAVDAKTSIATSLLYLFSPSAYLQMLIMYGTQRFVYRVDYIHANLSDQKLIYDQQEVHFKFREPYFKNTLYHLIDDNN